jgi:hypothetical protein
VGASRKSTNVGSGAVEMVLESSSSAKRPAGDPTRSVKLKRTAGVCEN